MATQDAVRYVGGPNGGQSTLVDSAELEQRVALPGGAYVLDNAVGGYRWEPDAQRADRTPRDGDEASALLAEHGGATPVLVQDVTSSTTVASVGAPVEAPKPQTKVATGSAARRATKG